MRMNTDTYGAKKAIVPMVMGRKGGRLQLLDVHICQCKSIDRNIALGL